MQHRYITNSTPACSFDVMLPALATKVPAENNVWDGMIVLNPVLLEQLSTIVVDRAPGPYILNVETVDISPKPPWSVVCLEADNAKCNLNSQIACMLSPPLVQFQMQGTSVRLRPIPWPAFWDYATATYWQNQLSLVCVQSATEVSLMWCCQMDIQFKIPWVSFCCLEYGVLSHMFIQYPQQQVITALKHLHGHCLHTGYCQSFIQGNSSAVKCWKHWLPLLEGAVQVNDFQLRPKPLSIFTCYAMVVGADISIIFSNSAGKCTLNCEFSNYCMQSQEFLETAMPVNGFTKTLIAGSIQSFQGTTLCAFETSKGVSESYEYIVALAILPLHLLRVRRTVLLLSVNVRTLWPLLDRRSVAFQFLVLHLVAFCKVQRSQPMLVCIAGATVPFSRQVLPHCCPVRVHVVLLWSDSECESDFIYVHVTVTGILLSDDVIHSLWKPSWASSIGILEWNHWPPGICMSSVVLYSVMSAQPAYNDSLVDDSDKFSVSEMAMLKFLAMTWHCSACAHVVLLKFTHKWQHKKSIFKLLLLRGNQTVKMTIRIFACVVLIDNEKIQRKTRLFIWIVAANDILQHIMMSWFSGECCSSGILTSKFLLEKQSVCHFKHEDHNCSFCHWEKHLLADNILTIAENARQLKRDGILLITICQVQKQLHIPNADTLFTASLGSLHGTVRGHPRIPCNFLQWHNCCYWNHALLFGHLVYLGESTDDMELPMEHLTASSGHSLEGDILSKALPFCWPIQLPAIHICAYHTSTGPRLSRVAGHLTFKIQFYHLMTDDP